MTGGNHEHFSMLLPPKISFITCISEGNKLLSNLQATYQPINQPASQPTNQHTYLPTYPPT